MQNKNTFVKNRHKIYFILAKPIAWIVSKLVHYKVNSHFKIKKGEQYLVLSNHQTDYDGVLVALSFNKILYPIVSDTVMSNGITSKLLYHCLGFIPKKKGTMDIKANTTIKQCVDEGGSILLFPEGNRTYAEFQFSFTKSFAKFVKNLKLPVVLFNIHGGTGTLPRFANKRRKGDFYGRVKKILPYDAYKDMSDDELYSIISENLKVYDSSTNQKFESDRSAEYLEREFFICPKCGSFDTLVSSGNVITCTDCGFEAEYKNNLHLKTNDSKVGFTKLLDWYNFQIRTVRDMEIKSGTIFMDNDVELYSYKPLQKRKLIEKGSLELTDKQLRIGNTSFDISEISNASPISGTKFNFSIGDNDYLIIGNPRFNPLKYVLMFNKLDTKMKETNADIYYNLEEREE